MQYSTKNRNTSDRTTAEVVFDAPVASARALRDEPESARPFIYTGLRLQGVAFKSTEPETWGQKAHRVTIHALGFDQQTDKHGNAMFSLADGTVVLAGERVLDAETGDVDQQWLSDKGKPIVIEEEPTPLVSKDATLVVGCQLRAVFPTDQNGRLRKVALQNVWGFPQSTSDSGFTANDFSKAPYIEAIVRDVLVTAHTTGDENLAKIATMIPKRGGAPVQQGTLDAALVGAQTGEEVFDAS